MFRPVALASGLFALVFATPVFGQTTPPATSAERAELARIMLGREESIRRINEARAMLRRGIFSDAVNLVAGANFMVDPEVVEGGAAGLAHAMIYLGDGDLRSAWNKAYTAQDARDSTRELVIESAMLNAFVFAKANLWSAAVQSLELVQKMDPQNQAAKYLLELFAENKKREGRIWQIRSPGFVCEFALRPIPRQGKDPAYVLHYYDLDGQPLRVMDFDSRPAEEGLQRFMRSFNCGYVENARYSIMRAELEALVAIQQGVAPLAAGWARYATAPPPGLTSYLTNAKLIEAQVKKPLQDEHAWNWEHVATWEMGPYELSGYQIAEYSNLDFANGKGGDVRGSYETWYFTIFSRNPKRYLGSFSIASEEPAPGMRLWFLKRNIWGRQQVVQTYPSMPGTNRVRADVIELLKQSGAPAIAATRPVRIDDSLSDEVATYDEQWKDWQQAGSLRKYYRIEMTAGRKYAIDLTSRDFSACVRLEDGNGRMLAEGRSGSIVIKGTDPKTGVKIIEFDPAGHIRFTAPRGGAYRIVVTAGEKSSLRGVGDSGRYTLTVREER